MVPVPEEYTYEYFLTGPADTSKATVTCLLPNGIVICLNTRYDVTLAELKEVLLKPLLNILALNLV